MERLKLLAIDIGNSQISVGLFNGDNKVERIDLPTSEKAIGFLAKKWQKYDSFFAASVVPDISRLLLKRVKSPKLHFITHKDIPLKYKRVKNIERVGIDRLINSYSAHLSCKRDSIIVGLGTATIVDGVTSEGECVGGIILPGVGTMLKSLHENTAMLPDVTFSPVPDNVGLDTKTAMILGAQLATLGGINEAIDKLRTVLPGARVIVTGGWSKVFANLFRFEHEINSNLTLQGIYQCGLKIAGSLAGC